MIRWTKNRARKALADVLPVWCVLTVITSLPYVIAELRSPAGFIFTGVLSAYDDTFSYLAWIKQGAQGHLLMLDMFTSEPHGRHFFLPLWACLGLISRATGLPAAIVFHAGRIVAALLLLLAARAVTRTVMISRARVRYTLWLLAFSAGFGWLLFVANRGHETLLNPATKLPGGSADLDIPEAITFRAAFAQAHLTLGATLFYAAMALVILSLIQRKRALAVLAGAMISLLALVHPFDVIVAGVVAALAFALWPHLQAIGRAQRKSRNLGEGLRPDSGDLPKEGRRSKLGTRRAAPTDPSRFETNTTTDSSRFEPNTTRPRPVEPDGQKVPDGLRLAAWFGAGCVPALIYLLLLYGSNDVGREWSRIISALSPRPREYLIGFGMVAVLATAGFWLLWRGRKASGRLLVIWAVVQSALLYAPFSFQRRFVEGLQLPLSIAASVVLFWLTSRVRRPGSQRSRRRPFLIAAIAISSITNVGFIAAETSLLTPADQRRYVNADLGGAFKWLSAHAEPDSILFSAYKTGNIAPALSGLRVYIGHYDLTVHCREKQEQVEAFFSGRMSGVEARSLLKESGAAYCIYGPFEREIAPQFSPPDCLEPVYNNGDVQLFKFVP